MTQPADERARASVRPLTGWLTAAAFVLIAGGIAAAFWMEHPHYYRKWDLEDLAVYRTAGQAVIHGHSVFGPYVAKQLHVHLPFIYPPIAAVVAAPLSLIGETQVNVLWTAFTVVVFGAVVRVCFAPLLDRYGRAAPDALAVAIAAMVATTPVQDHVRYGQVGILLMAACVFDCVTPSPRWPRGLLVGFATAFKLVPGIFIPYLALTRRWRAAAVATATFLALSLAGGIIAPSDSWHFWTSGMFQPTSPQWFANQSLEGILERAIGPWRLVWLPCVAAILVYGLWRAAIASRGGDELRGVALTGLVGVIVSPISWIHHLVWIVPVIAVIVGRGTDRKRVGLAFVITALFVARLPYIGNDELHGHGLLAGVLEASYGLMTIGLVLYLANARTVAREWRARNRAARSRAASVAVQH